MIYLRLFWEFFKVGLFSIGGGMATIPFLFIYPFLQKHFQAGVMIGSLKG